MRMKINIFFVLVLHEQIIKLTKMKKHKTTITYYTPEYVYNIFPD